MKPCNKPKYQRQKIWQHKGKEGIIFYSLSAELSKATAEARRQYNLFSSAH